VTEARTYVASSAVLAGRAPRCRTAFPRTAIFFATLPLVFGVALVLADGGFDQRSGLQWLNGVGVVALVAGWMWTWSFGGLADRIRWGLAARRTRRRPDAPWTTDHRWNPAGHFPRVSREFFAVVGCRAIVARLIAVGVIAWFTSLAAWLVFDSTRAAAFAEVLVFGGGASLWLWRSYRVACRGRPHVAFARFPYFTGETVRLFFGMSEGGDSFEHATYVLRRIEEEPGGLLGQDPWCWQSIAIHLATSDGALPGPGNDVVLDFDVPADAGGTSLSAPYPRYWELEVHGGTSGGPFGERFLVPIYERPADVGAGRHD
jgi:hypothetical protein